MKALKLKSVPFCKNSAFRVNHSHLSNQNQAFNVSVVQIYNVYNLRYQLTFFDVSLTILRIMVFVMCFYSIIYLFVCLLFIDFCFPIHGQSCGIHSHRRNVFPFSLFLFCSFHFHVLCHQAHVFCWNFSEVRFEVVLRWLLFFFPCVQLLVIPSFSLLLFAHCCPFFSI